MGHSGAPAAAEASAATADPRAVAQPPWCTWVQYMNNACAFSRESHFASYSSRRAVFFRYRRYTRWRQTSREEAVAAESSLLALSGCEARALSRHIVPLLHICAP